MQAIIKVDVPEWQIGEEVSVYFPDGMVQKGKCGSDNGIKKKTDHTGKCGKCKWLSKEKTGHFYICENTNKNFRSKTSHFRYKCNPGCKLYEEDEE